MRGGEPLLLPILPDLTAQQVTYIFNVQKRKIQVDPQERIQRKRGEKEEARIAARWFDFLC